MAACLLTFGIHPGVAQTDYSWNNSSSGLSAGLWDAAANWLPNDSAGPPGPGDNVVTPTLFGNINVNIASAQVTDWTYDSASSFMVFANTVHAALNISGTLNKSGSGTLTFRNSSFNLSVTAGSIVVSDGTLVFGGSITGTQAVPSVVVNDSFEVSGGIVNFKVGTASGTGPGAVTIGGLLTVGSGATVNLRGQGDSTTTGVTTVSANGLTGSGTIQANSNSGNGHIAVLNFANDSGSQDFSGIVRNGSNPAAGNVLSVTKSGAGTQILSGNSNAYSGGTTISAGTLLVNNTSGSGTGTGIVTVNGGMFGGTGIVAPTGTNGIGVAAGGYIAPGASIGTLTFNMGGTTGIVDLLGGGDFRFELGAANDIIGNIAPGSSDLLVISGASAGDVVFATDTTIDLLGTASVEGYYKLFDTDGDATTWTGLTLGDATTGGNFITGGLTATNFGGGYSGYLILADGSAGTSAGDIYLQVVPEPSTGILLAFAGTALVVVRRFRRTRV